MPNIDLSILNQRQTPAFYADVFANRPAAGFVGRIFVSTDTYAFYRDNGTSWDLIGGPGTGTVTGSGAAGQVAFWSGSSLISGENNLWWDSTNNHFGINTNTPGTAADIHHNQSTVLQLNQTTATNDTRIAFQNSGTSLWRIGNFYNGGANDLGIFDVVGNIQPVTVKKNTGQVLIGTSTVGSGKLVVASATSDNGIQIVGANAPSLRIDSAESGPTKRAGLGISTATNNFIQGSADRDFCMFNGSTTASPILFGIYDAAAVNVQEAARISAARNFLIGTTTDAGFKLDVNGIARVNGNITTGALLLSATTLYGAGNVGLVNRSADTTLYMTSAVSGFILLDNSQNTMYQATPTTHIWNTNNTEKMRLTSAGNVGIGTNAPATTLEVLGLNEGEYFRGGGGTISGRSLTFSSFTVSGTVGVGHRISAPNASANLIFSVAGSDRLSISNTGAATFSSTLRANSEIYTYTGSNFGYWGVDNGNSYVYFGTNSSGFGLSFQTAGSERMRLSSSGNLLIGTTTDSGAKLQVNGTANINGTIIGDNFLSVSGAVSNPFAVWTTMFTIPTNQICMYQLIAVSAGNGLTYTASALIVVNSAGIELRNYVPGGALVLQISGYNVQVQNGSGSTLSINYKYIKIG